MSSGEKKERLKMPQWYTGLSVYKGTWGRAFAQLADTVLPYLAIFAFMIYTVEAGWPYWSTLLLCIPACLFLVRTFIIFHDCAHGSFTPSPKANRVIGFVTGALTFTAFEAWRISHLKHHATNGQLDHRGFGDVWTMTFEEFSDAPWSRRLWYRTYRNPFFLFVFGPLVTFVIGNRIAGLENSGRERRSVILANVAIAGMAVGVWLVASFRAYVLVQMPVILISGMMGIWLFYVQHQFDPGYWARDNKWNKLDAAMEGASYYKLPPVIRWFTGNIGIHHLHHLRPAIPNYLLQRAYKSTPELHDTKPLTIWASLKSLRINLWHETQQRFLSFRQAARLMKAGMGADGAETRS
jgi:acyl-lipid omega-6 desaturase (Delta-12 desaturase)